MFAKKTAIVTGAQQGIGAGLVEGFLKSDYNVVATSLDATKTLTATADLAVVNRDIRDPETASRSVKAAITHFGSIDVLVNNAGIYLTKPFTEFTTEDFSCSFGQSAGIPPHDTTRGEPDAKARIGVCHNYFCRARR